MNEPGTHRLDPSWLERKCFEARPMEQENQAADDETGEDRKHEQPSAQAGIPGRHSGPEAE